MTARPFRSIASVLIQRTIVLAVLCMVVVFLLIRPCEVLSRVANVTILEVANNALRVLLQHRHVIIGSLA